MEALLSSVVIKDGLGSADCFIPFTLQEEEFLSQEIKMQYKLHIKSLEKILVASSWGSPAETGTLLPPNQPQSVPEEVCLASLLNTLG